MKETYFPNWHVTGAKGPYRLAPNMMVVVPTSKHVELTYGLTSADWAGRAITVGGAVGLVLLGLWSGARRFAADDGGRPTDTAEEPATDELETDPPDPDDSSTDEPHREEPNVEPDGGTPDPSDEPPDRKEAAPALP